MLNRPGRHTAAECDQRGLGTEDRTRTQRDQGSEQDARQLRSRSHAAGLEAVGGLVASGAGQVRDDCRHQQSPRQQGQDRPPSRHPAEAKLGWQAGVHPVLQLVRGGQEQPGGGRDRDARDRGDDQELQVAAGAQLGCWPVGRSQRSPPAREWDWPPPAPGANEFVPAQAVTQPGASLATCRHAGPQPENAQSIDLPGTLKIGRTSTWPGRRQTECRPRLALPYTCAVPRSHLRGHGDASGAHRDVAQLG
jgi:hypothetical protein